MRVMVFVKATEDSESGFSLTTESKKMMQDMDKFNNELREAGILEDVDGLTPSSKGKRVTFNGSARAVIDGPFGNARELVASYWIWEVENMDEAIAWVKRCPNPMLGPSVIEIRPFQEIEDLEHSNRGFADIDGFWDDSGVT